MPYAQIAAAVVPSLANAAINRFTSPRETDHEKQLRGMAELFKEQADTPYLETDEGRAFTSEADRSTRRDRKRNRNRNVRTGGTDEAQIATDQAINESHAANMNRIVGRGTRHRQAMIQNYLGTLSSANELQRHSEEQWRNQVAAISGGLGEGAAMAIDHFIQDEG